MAYILLILFGGSLLITLTCLAYPLLTYLRRLLSRKQINRSKDFTSPVSIVIAAYNEEAFIRQKINFFLHPEEWIPGSELIVVSAGSSDATNDILAEFSNHTHVRTLIIQDHLPKTQALNRALAFCTKEIIVFSDCRQNIQPGSVRNLVSYFSDPEIGAVNSTLLDNKEGGRPSPMRKLINFICLNDSVSGSSLNLYGALYAQRFSLFKNFPDDIMFDDLFASVSTLVQGKRLVQASDVIIQDVHFYDYFKKNRLERNARGAIIFLTRHWSMIKRLSTPVLLRFLVFKYFKLLSAPLLACLLIGTAYYLNAGNLTLFIGALFLVLICLLLVKNSRAFIVSVIRINYYFTTALLKHLFEIRPTLHWEKLSKEQSSQT